MAKLVGKVDGEWFIRLLFSFCDHLIEHGNTLDQMAKQGRRFTDFVASTAVCSASRIALLTGCNHRRVGISGALGPSSKFGINSEEMTLAELCKQKGYATACFGKWHLGVQQQFLPLQHGFDHGLLEVGGPTVLDVIHVDGDHAVEDAILVPVEAGEVSNQHLAISAL